MNNVNTYNRSNRNNNNDNRTMAKRRPKQIQKNIDQEKLGLYLVTSIFVFMLTVFLACLVVLIVTFKESENGSFEISRDSDNVSVFDRIDRIMDQDSNTND